MKTFQIFLLELTDGDNETDYEGDSEDNASIVEVSKKKLLPKNDLAKYISNLDEKLREIQHQRKEREECLESIERTMEKFEMLRAGIEEGNIPRRIRKVHNLISDTGSDDKTESDLQSEKIVESNSPQPYSYCEET